ncbi:MAG: hypothetical protein AKCLJLPJ_01574 [Fimbriimonadales bacterium]|nr:hypothetical protein [Fimbriimonadales bacterium]
MQQILIAILLLAIGAIFAYGFSQDSRELTLKSLRFVNEDGKPAALFYGTKEGFEGYVYGRSAEGQDYVPALKLTGDKTGGQIELFDEKGRKVLDFVRGDSGGAIAVYHESGEICASLSAWSDRGSRLELMDTRGRERAFLEADLLGALLKMNIAKGPVVSLYTLLDGGHLALFDEKLDAVVNLPPPK